MAQFKLNQTISQPDAVVTVETSRADPLPVGANRFQLVVVDDDGNESESTFIDVIVQDPKIPTAVIDVVNADGRRVDPTVVAGQNFILSGGRSTDIDPGKIVEYRFTLIDRT